MEAALRSRSAIKTEGYPFRDVGSRRSKVEVQKCPPFTDNLVYVRNISIVAFWICITSLLLIGLLDNNVKSVLLTVKCIVPTMAAGITSFVYIIAELRLYRKYRSLSANKLKYSSKSSFEMSVLSVKDRQFSSLLDGVEFEETEGTACDLSRTITIASSNSECLYKKFPELSLCLESQSWNPLGKAPGPPPPVYDNGNKRLPGAPPGQAPKENRVKAPLSSLISKKGPPMEKPPMVLRSSIKKRPKHFVLGRKLHAKEIASSKITADSFFGIIGGRRLGIKGTSLAETFGQRAIVEARISPSSNALQVKPKTKLLPDSRAQNLAIVLAKLSLPIDRLVQVLLKPMIFPRIIFDLELSSYSSPSLHLSPEDGMNLLILCTSYCSPDRSTSFQNIKTKLNNTTQFPSVSKKCPWCRFVNDFGRDEIDYYKEFKSPRESKLVSGINIAMSPTIGQLEATQGCMSLLGQPQHCLGNASEDLEKLLAVFPNDFEKRAIQIYKESPEELRDVERNLIGICNLSLANERCRITKFCLNLTHDWAKFNLGITRLRTLMSNVQTSEAFQWCFVGVLDLVNFINEPHEEKSTDEQLSSQSCLKDVEWTIKGIVMKDALKIDEFRCKAVPKLRLQHYLILLLNQRSNTLERRRTLSGATGLTHTILQSLAGASSATRSSFVYGGVLEEKRSKLNGLFGTQEDLTEMFSTTSEPHLMDDSSFIEAINQSKFSPQGASSFVTPPRNFHDTSCSSFFGKDILSPIKRTFSETCADEQNKLFLVITPPSERTASVTESGKGASTSYTKSPMQSRRLSKLKNVAPTSQVGCRLLAKTFPTITDEVRREVPMLNEASRILPAAYENILSDVICEVNFFRLHVDAIEAESPTFIADCRLIPLRIALENASEVVKSMEQEWLQLIYDADHYLAFFCDPNASVDENISMLSKHQQVKVLERAVESLTSVNDITIMLEKAWNDVLLNCREFNQIMPNAPFLLAEIVQTVDELTEASSTRSSIFSSKDRRTNMSDLRRSATIPVPLMNPSIQDLEDMNDNQNNDSYRHYGRRTYRISRNLSFCSMCTLPSETDGDATFKEPFEASNFSVVPSTLLCEDSNRILDTNFRTDGKKFSDSISTSNATISSKFPPLLNINSSTTGTLKLHERSPLSEEDYVDADASSTPSSCGDTTAPANFPKFPQLPSLLKPKPSSYSMRSFELMKRQFSNQSLTSPVSKKSSVCQTRDTREQNRHVVPLLNFSFQNPTRNFSMINRRSWSANVNRAPSLQSSPIHPPFEPPPFNPSRRITKPIVPSISTDYNTAVVSPSLPAKPLSSSKNLQIICSQSDSCEKCFSKFALSQPIYQENISTEQSQVESDSRCCTHISFNHTTFLSPSDTLAFATSLNAPPISFTQPLAHDSHTPAVVSKASETTPVSTDTLRSDLHFHLDIPRPTKLLIDHYNTDVEADAAFADASKPPGNNILEEEEVSTSKRNLLLTSSTQNETRTKIRENEAAFPDAMEANKLNTLTDNDNRNVAVLQNEALHILRLNSPSDLQTPLLFKDDDVPKLTETQAIFNASPKIASETKNVEVIHLYSSTSLSSSSGTTDDIYGFPSSPTSLEAQL